MPRRRAVRKNKKEDVLECEVCGEPCEYTSMCKDCGESYGPCCNSMQEDKCLSCAVGGSDG